MTKEGPKLYTNKPKKAQLTQFQQQQQQRPSPAPAPSSMASQSSSPIPPQPPKESFARRYRFMWPLLLTVNFAVGAYLFMRTRKKDIEGEVPAVTSTPTVAEKLPSPPAIMKLREPIPEDQQHELFKWMLEEKRKVKPENPSEKKRNDEEKAIIKQFLRAKSLPPL